MTLRPGQDINEGDRVQVYDRIAERVFEGTVRDLLQAQFTYETEEGHTRYQFYSHGEHVTIF